MVLIDKKGDTHDRKNDSHLNTFFSFINYHCKRHQIMGD